MKKIIAAASLVLLGLGCNQKPPANTYTNEADTNTTVTVPNNLDTTSQHTTSTAVADSKKLSVKKTFTLDEIEAEGGLKNWFRDLARANVAGKKTLVRVPINHVFGFGCVAPLKYCVSTETGGCFGPFVALKGDFEIIKKATNSCNTVCNSADDTRCTQDFRNNQCSTLWEVEGYVVAANRLPEAHDDGTRGGTCADGQLTYDFQVTRVIQKIANGGNDDFLFYEYR